MANQDPTLYSQMGGHLLFFMPSFLVLIALLTQPVESKQINLKLRTTLNQYSTKLK